MLKSFEVKVTLLVDADDEGDAVANIVQRLTKNVVSRSVPRGTVIDVSVQGGAR